MTAPWLMTTYATLTFLMAPLFLVQSANAQTNKASKESTEQQSQQAKSLIKQARAARKRGDLIETAALLLRAFSLDPKPVLLNNLGKIYEEMGRYDLAYATYKRVVDDPNTSQKLRDLDKETRAPYMQVFAWICWSRWHECCPAGGCVHRGSGRWELTFLMHS